MADAGEKRSLMKKVKDSIRPGDPYAYVTAPRFLRGEQTPLRRGPKGRSGAAVAEIEDDSDRSFPPRK